MRVIRESVLTSIDWSVDATIKHSLAPIQRIELTPLEFSEAVGEIRERLARGMRVPGAEIGSNWFIYRGVRCVKDLNV